ncbi:MAG: MBL fold metallo-hydrolase [Euryarchaeota archaeon]|nr:MBL fold metallo-hydrolase [Euryarchaeota archaeon]
MRIEILGTRGHIEPSAPNHMFHSGVLVNDVLFDIGERIFLDRNPQAILLTHLHSDHAFFTEDELDSLPVPTYAPQRWREHPEIQVIRNRLEIDGLVITPIPTVHSASYRSCAYLIEEGCNRIIYTGDLVSVRRRYRDRIPEIDLVITDGSFIREGGLVRRDDRGRLHGHNGIPDLVRFFSPFTPRIVITHFGSWFFRDIDESIRAIESLGNATSVEAAYDGMIIEL